MNKAILRYIWTLAVITVLAALFNSEITLIIAAAVFTVAALLFPLGATAVAAFVCVAIYAFLTQDPAAGAIMALSFVLPATAMAFALRMRRGLAAVIGAGTAANAFATLMLYYYESLKAHTTVINLLSVKVPEALSGQMTSMGYKEQEIHMIESLWKSMSELIPSIIMISALVFSFLTFAVAKAIIKRTGGKLVNIRDFMDMRADISFTIFAMVLTVAAFFASGTALNIILNALYFIYVIYIAFGAASAVRAFKKLTKHTFPAALITIMIGFFTLGTGLALMGVISSFTGKNKPLERE